MNQKYKASIVFLLNTINEVFDSNISKFVHPALSDAFGIGRDHDGMFVTPFTALLIPHETYLAANFDFVWIKDREMSWSVPKFDDDYQTMCSESGNIIGIKINDTYYTSVIDFIQDGHDEWVANVLGLSVNIVREIALLYSKFETDETIAAFKQAIQLLRWYKPDTSKMTYIDIRMNVEELDSLML